MLCPPLDSLLKMCFCFIGISCKPQEAIPARVSGSTFCLSSSTLHQGQSCHPYVTVYFYPYYKTGLESQIKKLHVSVDLLSDDRLKTPRASGDNVQKWLSTEKQGFRSQLRR